MTDTAPRFIAIVNYSFEYEQTRRAILNRLEADFINIENFAKKVSLCSEIYKHSITFEFENWIKENNPDMGQIKEMFEKFKLWEDTLARNIEPRKNSGMI
jgi:hypothetical protein